MKRLIVATLTIILSGTQATAVNSAQLTGLIDEMGEHKELLNRLLRQQDRVCPKTHEYYRSVRNRAQEYVQSVRAVLEAVQERRARGITDRHSRHDISPEALEGKIREALEVMRKTQAGQTQLWSQEHAGRAAQQETHQSSPAPALFFGDSKTLGELRRNYKERALTLHPDKSGDPALFQRMQQEYEYTKNLLEDSGYVQQLLDDALDNDLVLPLQVLFAHQGCTADQRAWLLEEAELLDKRNVIAYIRT